MSRRLIGVVALVVTGAVLGGCATPSQMIADHKMAELCAKDGGVQVFQTVEIPVDDYDFSRNEPKGMSGAISICSGSHLAFGSRYSAMCSYDVVYGKKESTHIMRSVYEYRDVSTAIVLGRSVRYTRFGGDFPLTAAEPIGYPCPVGSSGLVKAIFKPKGDSQ